MGRGQAHQRTDEAALDKAEADLAKAKIILLYDSGFSDFSTSGVM